MPGMLKLLFAPRWSDGTMYSRMNEQMEFSSHAKDMLSERKISEEWVWRTVNSPDSKKTGADSNTHYTKAIEEREGRILHVIVNPNIEPNRVVTVFFDRRLKRKK